MGFESHRRPSDAEGCARVLLLLVGVVVLAGTGTAVMGWVQDFRKPSDRVLRERYVIGNLAAALAVFEMENGRPSGLQKQYAATGGRILSGEGLLEPLLGIPHPLNPVGVCYLEPPGEYNGSSKRPRSMKDSNGMLLLLDSFGHAYHIILDVDGDRHVPDPMRLGKRVEASALVWSGGPDGDPDTWQDNIKSWE